MSVQRLHALEVLSILGLSAVVAWATASWGWRAPPFVGALTGLSTLGYASLAQWPTGPVLAPGAKAALATVLGWGALLVWSLLGGQGGAVVAMLGSLTGVRGPGAYGVAAVLVVVTLALGALLAWAAATLVAGLLRVGPASAPGHVTLSETSGRLRAP